MDSLLPEGKLAFSSLTLNISRALIFNNNVLHPSCARHGTRCWGDLPGPALVGPLSMEQVDTVAIPQEEVSKWSRKLGWGRGGGEGIWNERTRKAFLGR